MMRQIVLADCYSTADKVNYKLNFSKIRFEPCTSLASYWQTDKQTKRLLDQVAFGVYPGVFF
jgi:hypothetical protein